MKNTSYQTPAAIERAIRCIRQRMFTKPEAVQLRCTAAIGTLKARIAGTWTTSRNYHWMYAAE